MPRTRILLVSRSNAVASEIDLRIRGHRQFDLETKVVSNGHVDPLHDAGYTPDILLLHCMSGHGELQYLAETRSPNQPPLIVIGPENDPDAMRLAMRAGASDYLTAPLKHAELISSLERLSQHIDSTRAASGRLVTVINSRGGSGASFLAANLAYGFHAVDDVRTLLVDFDLQFGGLCRYFDLNPKQGIIEALDAVDDMDEVSGESYVTRHSSGLRLLAARTDSLHLSNEVPAARIDMLLRMFLQHNEIVVVDLPRHIDLRGATILESSDRILLVVQQSLGHLHDALRLVRLITQELGVSTDRVTVILNRFDKKSIIETNDVRGTLKVDQILEVPNHDRLVSESIDTGKPLLDGAKNSSVARAIGDLRAHVRGLDRHSGSRSILQRAIPSLLRRT